MLAELLLNTVVTCQPHARRLGYGKGLVSLWSRSRRCTKAWAPHHAATRNFVEDLVQTLPSGGNVWVLGAGLLDDVPLDLLSRHFSRVLLVDIAFLPGLRFRLRRFGNVEARLFDVTGLAAPLSQWQAGLPLPALNAEKILEIDSVPPSLVLSLNLLSQLPLLPLEWLQGWGQGFAVRHAYGRSIVSAHLRGLRRFDCPVGLVTDHRRVFRNRAGEVVVAESALFEVTPPVAEKEWTWALAPLGEIDDQTALDLRVMATRDVSVSG